MATRMLENIARNTEPKNLFDLLLSNNSTYIRTRFHITLQWNEKVEMTLLKCTTHFPSFIRSVHISECYCLVLEKYNFFSAVVY